MAPYQDPFESDCDIIEEYESPRQAVRPTHGIGSVAGSNVAMGPTGEAMEPTIQAAWLPNSNLANLVIYRCFIRNQHFVT